MTEAAEMAQATEMEGAMDAEAAAEATGAVLVRLMGDFAATAGVVLTELGMRLGLWDVLAGGPATAGTVAERAGAALPYVREWLRSQAAAGYLEYEPAEATFALAPGVAAVLGEGQLSGLASGVAAQFGVWWSELDRYEQAFRTGRGISWSALPAAHAAGMDMITRAVVAPSLVGGWLAALDGVEARLSAGAAVADVGCGYGAAVIAMAERFPASAFTGFDVDDASVARARKAALAAGVADRVGFEVASAAEIAGGPYDLVVFIDSLHDFGDPVGALRQCRRVVAEDGIVLLVEHAGSERLEENLHPVGRFFYAASALVCVPNALAGPGDGHPLGAIPGEQALRRAADASRFSRVRRIEADAPLNLLLELRP